MIVISILLSVRIFCGCKVESTIVDQNSGGKCALGISFFYRSVYFFIERYTCMARDSIYFFIEKYTCMERDLLKEDAKTGS